MPGSILLPAHRPVNLFPEARRGCQRLQGQNDHYGCVLYSGGLSCHLSLLLHLGPVIYLNSLNHGFLIEKIGTVKACASENPYLPLQIYSLPFPTCSGPSEGGDLHQVQRLIRPLAPADVQPRGYWREKREAKRVIFISPLQGHCQAEHHE